MTVTTVNLKQNNMLCHRCVLNVARALSHIGGIRELVVDLKEKRIKISYTDKRFNQTMVKNMVNEAIIAGKASGDF